MMKFKNLFKALPLSLLFVSLVFTNCAEKKEFKPLVDNIQRVKKSYFGADEGKLFIFGETVTKHPVEVANSTFPGLQSYKSRLVRFEFTEEFLNVIEITPFIKTGVYGSTNGTSLGTERVISRFPVQKHIDIWMAEDDYGNKTNHEAETEELGPWYTREYAIINFRGEQVLDRGFYLEMLRGYYQEDFALQVSTGELVELNLEDEILKITALKNMTLDDGTDPYLTYLKQKTTDNVEVTYSFLPVPVSDYVVKEYPEKWEKRMGYFATEIVYEDEYGRKQIKKLMNRWDTSKPIVFYLSESWNYPHNRKYKYLAQHAIDEWNKVFKDALGKTEDDEDVVVLKESDGTQKLGDLRYNMIQLVDEEFKSEPLGYGPSAANPLTGEIINSNVMIYFGALRQSLKYTKLRHDEELVPPVDDAVSFSSQNSDVNSSQNSDVNSSNVNILDKMLDKADKLNIPTLDQKLYSKTMIDRKGFLKAIDNYKQFSFTAVNDMTLKEKFNETAKYFKNEMIKDSTYKHLANGSRNGCYYPVPEQKIADYFTLGMSDDEIVDEILKGTIVHELGHNFGLRHNFRGSMDKANFWGMHEGEEEHLDPKTKEPIIHSTSVMDYESDFLHELKTPGRYDVETIKVGYSPDPLPEEVNFDFEFCTDQQRNEDALCNIFDRGTTAAAIMENLALDYHKYYSLRNLKIEGVKRFDTPHHFYGYLNNIFSRYLLPARTFLDYRQKRYYDKSEEIQDKLIELGMDDNTAYDRAKSILDAPGLLTVEDLTSDLQALGMDLEKAETLATQFKDEGEEIFDLNKAVMNSYHFLMSVLFNDKQDLDTIDDFTSELLVQGIIYDRIYSMWCLSMESIGVFGLNFTSVVTYPDVFDDMYFRQTEVVPGSGEYYSSDYFYKSIAKGPGGWFNKYYYKQRGFNTDPDSDRNPTIMSRPEIRTYTIEFLLEEMNTLGSTAKYETVIGARNVYDDEMIEKNVNKTLDNFFNHLAVKKDLYLNQLADGADLKLSVNNLMASLPTNPGDGSNADIYERVTELQNELQDVLVLADLTAASINAFDESAGVREGTRNELSNISTLWDATTWSYYNAVMDCQNFLFDVVFEKLPDYQYSFNEDGSIAMEESDYGFNPKRSAELDAFSAAMTSINGEYGLNFYYTRNDEVFRSLPLALDAGLFENDKYYNIYHPERSKMISIPKASSITSEVAINHKKYRGYLYDFNNIYAMLHSSDSEKVKLGNILMNLYGIEGEASLLSLIDTYTWYINMERDMLYEMADTYMDFVPGNSMW